MDADRAEVAQQTLEEPGKKTRRMWTAGENRQIGQQALRRGAVLQEVAQRPTYSRSPGQPYRGTACLECC